MGMAVVYVTPPEVEEIHDRIRTVADSLHVHSDLCSEVYEALFPAFGLGEESSIAVTTTTSFLGKTFTRTYEVTAWTAVNAMKEQFIDETEEGEIPEDIAASLLPSNLPAADTSKDTEAARDLRAAVYAFAVDMCNQGRIGAHEVNKYAKYLGIPEVPVVHQFVFAVPLAANVRYTIRAQTEDEARMILAVQTMADNDRVRNGHYRTHGSLTWTPNRGEDIRSSDTVVSLAGAILANVSPPLPAPATPPDVVPTAIQSI